MGSIRLSQWFGDGKGELWLQLGAWEGEEQEELGSSWGGDNRAC